jgi:putative addiction module killer protein
MDKKKEVLFYITKDGKCPIKNWLKKLDLKSRGRINVRLQRLEYGAYGDYKQISSNLYELRFFFGSGYRVYFTEKNNNIVLLLSGGDKDSQKKDIKQIEKIVELLE